MAAPRLFSPEEYLALERAAETRSEFYDGEIFAMAGTSLVHGQICMNIGGNLLPRLLAKGCRIVQSDLRVRPMGHRYYLYPDVVVVCSKPQLEDNVQDTLLNPLILFEVLSPSTERVDRGRKFEIYGRIESLTDYVLVSQDRKRVEHFHRQGPSDWHIRILERDEKLHFLAPECSLSLKDIYAGVDFAEAEDANRVE
jgi:Uma2 family endonuclease